MTHLYIELNGITEEVNSLIIEKLYNLASSGDLDETSDLKGRLHSTSAKEKHVTYLNNNFDDLYITADIQYITFEDPDVESLMCRYIGTPEGVTMDDIQNFSLSNIRFGDWYTNTHTNRSGKFATNSSERNSINTINELALFSGLKAVGMDTFGQNLTSILLPLSVSEIYDKAFVDCSALLQIDLSKIKTIGSEAFRRSGLTGVINLPSITDLTNYGNTTYNSSGLTFALCTNITEVHFGPNLNTFNTQSTFHQCTSLQIVTGLSSVLNIPGYTFYGCSSLVNVDIDQQNILSIGTSAFENCRSIQLFDTINIPNLVDSVLIGLYNAFARCTQIKHVVDLGRITTLGGDFGNDGAFSGCTELLDAVLPETLQSIGLSIFLGCNKLRYVKILANSMPVFDLENGFHTTVLYGGGFGEAWRNNDPSTNKYIGLTYPIYVKDSLLSQYQTADGWKYIGPGRLKPLSQFATDFPNG